MTAQPTEVTHRFALELLDDAIAAAERALDMLERRADLGEASRKLRLGLAKLQVVRAQARRERQAEDSEGTSTTAQAARHVGRESRNRAGGSG